MAAFIKMWTRYQSLNRINIQCMIYIKFPNYEIVPYNTASLLLRSYMDWLNINAGAGPVIHEDDNLKEWYWLRGDRYAQGVYIREPEVATMFKLKFEL